MGKIGKKKSNKEWCPICHNEYTKDGIDEHCNSTHKMSLDKCWRFAYIKNSFLCSPIIPEGDYDFIKYLLDDVFKFDEQQKLVFWMSMMFKNPLWKCLVEAKGGI